MHGNVIDAIAASTMTLGRWIISWSKSSPLAGAFVLALRMPPVLPFPG
jgi:hypothetical protein